MANPFSRAFFSLVARQRRDVVTLLVTKEYRHGSLCDEGARIGAWSLRPGHGDQGGSREVQSKPLLGATGQTTLAGNRAAGSDPAKARAGSQARSSRSKTPCGTGPKDARCHGSGIEGATGHARERQHDRPSVEG